MRLAHTFIYLLQIIQTEPFYQNPDHSGDLVTVSLLKGKGGLSAECLVMFLVIDFYPHGAEWPFTELVTRFFFWSTDYALPNTNTAILASFWFITFGRESKSSSSFDSLIVIVSIQKLSCYEILVTRQYKLLVFSLQFRQRQSPKRPRSLLHLPFVSGDFDHSAWHSIVASFL